LSAGRRFDRAARFRGAAFGDFGDYLAVGGIGNRNRGAAIGIDPTTVDICLGFEQCRIGKLNGHISSLRLLPQRREA